jgi:hypothetical protein
MAANGWISSGSCAPVTPDDRPKHAMATHGLTHGWTREGGGRCEARQVYDVLVWEYAFAACGPASGPGTQLVLSEI